MSLRTAACPYTSGTASTKCTCTAMQPDGIGSLYLAFEQLKGKLEAEGLFAPQRKRPIPEFPAAIGVITSPTGAAVRDIIITLQRRNPAVPVLLVPCFGAGKARRAFDRQGDSS